MQIFPFIEIAHTFDSNIKANEIIELLGSKTQAVMYGTKRLIHTENIFEGKIEANSFKIRLFNYRGRNVYPHVYGYITESRTETRIELKTKPWMAIKIGLLAFLLFILWLMFSLFRSVNITDTQKFVPYLIAVAIPSILFCIIYFSWRKFHQIQSEETFNIIEALCKEKA